MAKWSSPSIGDQRATGCQIILKILLNLIMAMIVHDSSGQIYNESESDQIFFFKYLSSEIMKVEKNEG